MKRIIIFGLVLIVACSKKSVPTNEHFKEVVLQLPESAKPALKISLQKITDSTVLIQWQKKGREVYTVYRKESQTFDSVYSCQCGSFIDTLQPGVYSYKVNNSNVLSVEIKAGVTPPTNLPAIISINFKGGKINSENAFIPDSVSGCDLSQEDQDWIFNYVVQSFWFSPITFVRDQPGTQECFVTNTNWYGGGAGGVSFQNSYGTGEPCYVFPELLYNFREFIAKAIVHELGHTLGLEHLLNNLDCTNHMSNCYSIPQQFVEAVYIYTGELWNQRQRINDKVSQ